MSPRTLPSIPFRAIVVASRNSAGVRDALTWRKEDAAVPPPPEASARKRGTTDIIGWSGSAAARPELRTGGKKSLPTAAVTGGFNPVLGAFGDSDREERARAEAANLAAAAVLRKQRALPPSMAHSDGTAVDIITATRKSVEPSSAEVQQQRRLHAAALRYRQDPLIVHKDKEAEANDQRRVARIQRRCVAHSTWVGEALQFNVTPPPPPRCPASWVELRDRRFNIITGDDVAPLPAGVKTSSATLLAPTAFQRITAELPPPPA